MGTAVGVAVGVDGAALGVAVGAFVKLGVPVDVSVGVGGKGAVVSLSSPQPAMKNRNTKQAACVM